MARRNPPRTGRIEIEEMEISCRQYRSKLRVARIDDEGIGEFFLSLLVTGY